MPSNNPLPPKENALFKRILKCYELKQYKNGLKFAKQILNNVKFTEHGETLAMKGLTLNCLGRKEEAYDYVRRGLRNDLTSHVCWHVFGLLQRADKKYDEAIKAYRNALKWDKDNVQILRDLSLLQIQMRDLEGYRDTRYQLLRLRPGQRASWIGFATAYHLISDYSNALQVLEEFRKTLVKTGYDYEQSELLLYEAMVLGEAGDSAKALEHLDLYQNDICDKTTLLESKGQLLLQCKLGGQAEAIFRQLLDRNAENKSYYHGLEQALALQKGDLSVADKLSLYDELHQQYPRALLTTRIPLTSAAGDEFRQKVNAYLRRALAKGVPPLFVEMRSLYSDPQKVEIVQELMLNYVTSLQSTDKFSAEDAEAAPASALLWSYYFLCQHYDYLEDTSLALRYIDLALEHTPTLIELHVAKGRINKHAGNPLLAWQCLQEAAALDTADRYLNSKAAKYALRANLLQEAEEAASKFTRESVSAMENLNEMQCMWFQTECAAAYQRLGQYGDALKKCHEVDRHFSEILEDQFDFHTYCLRKITLRSYVRLLRLEDSLRGHPFYFKAAQVAINVYLTLHDHPPEFQDGTKEQEQAALTTTELKKLRAKQRKAQRKAEEEAAAERQQAERRELYAKNRQHHQEKTQAGEPEPPPPDELQPAKLIQTKDPLGEALKFLIPLQDFASDRVETHLLTFEIQHRRGKPLLMLQAVQRAVRVLGEREARAHPQMHTCLVRLAICLDKESKGQSPDAPLIPVLQRSSQQLFQGLTPYELNEQFLEKHANSVPHLLQGTRMLLLLDPKSEERAVKLVTRLENVTGRTQYHCSNVLYALQQGELGQVGIDAASEYQERCYALFPHATAFAPAGHKEGDASSPVTSNHLEE